MKLQKLNKHPAILLAPMDGVIEFYFRELLTAVGGYDSCVTEFLRVGPESTPDRTFLHICPELNTGSATSFGTPVFLQLLGKDPAAFARHAAQAVELGIHGIDINFGCPAKRVNQHGSGAWLLQFPDKIFAIVKATREAAPKEMTVSAKIRLGFVDTSQVLAVTDAIIAGGADFLTVHARTAKEAYRPPAHWQWIKKIKERSNIPVIANGDIWTLEDYIKCCELTSCDGVMLGRGAIVQPDLARQIRAWHAQEEFQQMPWSAFPELLLNLASRMQAGGANKYILPRVKQYANFLRLRHAEATALFNTIKRIDSVESMIDALSGYSDIQTTH